MIPDVPRQKILEAFARFDRDLRDTPEWQGWEANANYKYAIVHEGRRYPVKQVISLATNAPTYSFSGGNESNRYLAQRGITVVPLDEALHRTEGTVNYTAMPTNKTVSEQPGSYTTGLSDRNALQQLIERFQERYGSFETQEYINDERDYKVKAAEQLPTLLERNRLRQMIDERRFGDATAAIKRSASVNYMLGKWDQNVLRNAPAEPLARALYELLYGEAPFEQRFDAWADVLKQVKPHCWSPATFFLMLHDPQRYIFIKPSAYRWFIAQVAPALGWEAQPVSAFYNRVQALADTLLSELKSLGARDMIDVHSFIWVMYNEQQDTPGDDEDLESALAAITQTIENQLVRRIATEYHQWLQGTTGDAISFRYHDDRVAQGISVFVGGHLLQFLRFNRPEGLHVLLLNPSSRELELLRNRLSDTRTIQPDHIKSQAWAYREGYRFVVKTEADYELLKEVTQIAVKRFTGIDGRTVMPRVEQNAQFYEAARCFVERALRGDDSLFTPGRPIWSATTIDDLYERFVKQPDLSSDTFLVKFQRQLKDAPPDTIQLAAELLYVHLLVPRDINGKTKRDQIKQVLSWSTATVTIPSDLDAALDQGIAKTGIAFKTYRPYQLAFFLDFVRRWKQLPEAEQLKALDDPWDFKRVLFDIPIHAAYSQREALLHIVHPETFEPIVSGEHKSRYAQKYAHLVSEPTDDVDHRLWQIRRKLSPQHGPHFMFWNLEEPVDDAPLPRALGPKLRHYVELAVHLNDEAYTPEQIVDRLGQISPPIANLTARPDADELVSALLVLRLLEPLGDGLYRRWRHLADATLEHLLRYAALTLLVPEEGETFRLPAVDAPFDGRPHAAEDWPYGQPLLEWYDEAGLVQRNQDGSWQSRPDALQPLAADTPTARALNTFLEHLRQVRSSPRDLPALHDGPLRPLPPDVLEQRVTEIQRELLIERATLLRIYRSLIAGHHVILSGPPGTGKTHLARILPRIFWRDEEESVRYEMPASPELAPTEAPHPYPLSREGYAVNVVTATEDWGVRQVIGGIVPQLQRNNGSTTLIYGVRHGYLTRAVLQNYNGYDGNTIPPLEGLRRAEVTEDGRPYRGRWLVIDEFTRAPIDAAFGSLLTTLGGQSNATLPVPTDGGDELLVPLPGDFRIIGTLNSFDRHFLNQISEAMKRRFTFIDVLPPRREQADIERGIATYRALLRLARQGISAFDARDAEGWARWEGVLRVDREEVDGEEAQLHVRYQITPEAGTLPEAVESFWRIFGAIRVYRQLGTAQAEAALCTLFSGRAIGMSWNDALDSALADVLGDQLQVLSRDEQRVLLAYLDHPDDAGALTVEVKKILNQMPPPRQAAHLRRLRLAGAELNDSHGVAELEPAHLTAVFDVTRPLVIDGSGLFAARISAFIDETGL